MSIEVDFQLGEHDDAARLVSDAFAEVLDQIEAASRVKPKK